MKKMISVDMIECAFDEVIDNIDKIEIALQSQIEIEVNEMTLAQLEKIGFVNSYLSQLDMESKKVPFQPRYKLAFSR